MVHSDDPEVENLLDDYAYWLDDSGEDESAEDEEMDSELDDDEAWDEAESEEEDDSDDDEGDPGDAAYDEVEGDFDEDEGEIPPAAPVSRVKKAGRNEPCPCGSGKKYGKCCWNKDRQEEPAGEAKSFRELLKGALAETFRPWRRRREVPATVRDTAYRLKITLTRADRRSGAAWSSPIARSTRCTSSSRSPWVGATTICTSSAAAKSIATRVSEDRFSPVRAETSMALSGLLEQGCRKFEYEYDFGDSWEHEIKIEKTLPEGTRPAIRCASRAKGPVRPKTAGASGATRRSLKPSSIATIRTTPNASSGLATTTIPTTSTPRRSTAA